MDVNKVIEAVGNLFQGTRSEGDRAAIYQMMVIIAVHNANPKGNKSTTWEPTFQQLQALGHDLSDMAHVTRLYEIFLWVMTLPTQNVHDVISACLANHAQRSAAISGSSSHVPPPSSAHNIGNNLLSPKEREKWLKGLKNDPPGDPSVPFQSPIYSREQAREIKALYMTIHNKKQDPSLWADFPAGNDRAQWELVNQIGQAIRDRPEPEMDQRHKRKGKGKRKAHDDPDADDDELELEDNAKCHRVTRLSDRELALISWEILDCALDAQKGITNMPKWALKLPKWDGSSPSFRARLDSVLECLRISKAAVSDMLVPQLIYRIMGQPDQELQTKRDNKEINAAKRRKRLEGEAAKRALAAQAAAAASSGPAQAGHVPRRVAPNSAGPPPKRRKTETKFAASRQFGQAQPSVYASPALMAPEASISATYPHSGPFSIETAQSESLRPVGHVSAAPYLAPAMPMAAKLEESAHPAYPPPNGQQTWTDNFDAAGRFVGQVLPAAPIAQSMPTMPPAEPIPTTYPPGQGQMIEDNFDFDFDFGDFVDFGASDAVSQVPVAQYNAPNMPMMLPEVPAPMQQWDSVNWSNVPGPPIPWDGTVNPRDVEIQPVTQFDVNNVDGDEVARFLAEANNDEEDDEEEGSADESEEEDEEWNGQTQGF